MRSEGRGRGVAGAAALLLAAGLVGAPGGLLRAREATAAAFAATDAFRVTAPKAPWARAADLDPPGRLTWTLTDPSATTAQLRVEYIGVRSAVPESALAEVLGRERADIALRSEKVSQLERGAFEPDSAGGGPLAWRGFHVHVRAGERSGEIRRWAALAPGFPQRRRAYLVALDEQTLPGARAVPREADARALLASLAPTGKGLAGGLADAYLDARVSAFTVRVDTTTRLCWRADDAEPGHAFVGVARGLAGDGDFFQSAAAIPPDSVVDAGSSDYGVGFDRNGDGRIDLAVLNRGVVSARGASMQPIVVVLADDDFDGRVDGCVLETGDADGDGRADHRLGVFDLNHDGRPDRAVRFGDVFSDRSNKELHTNHGLVEDRLVGSAVNHLDFAQSWRDGDALLARWNRALASCRP
jgi:hypothetical protein